MALYFTPPNCTKSFPVYCDKIQNVWILQASEEVEDVRNESDNPGEGDAVRDNQPEAENTSDDDQLVLNPGENAEDSQNEVRKILHNIYPTLNSL